MTLVLLQQMGSNYKKAIFEENVQVGLVGWAQKVKNKRANNGNEGSSKAGTSPSPPGAPSAGAGFAGIQLNRLTRNNAGETTQNEITPAHDNH